MKREAQEEIGITPLNPHYVGYIKFLENVNGELINLKMYIYTATKWIGNITESEEMRPIWFQKDNIPYSQMFPDDQYWLPYLLNNQDFNAYFEFDENWQILKKQIKLKKKEN